MMRSLFLFDMTFWLYLAALGLYVAYLFAKRPAMQMAPAGHPIDNLEDRDGAWATQLGQVATLVTVFGWVLNTMALMTRAFERMEHSGTFAPWSNQFEAMAYVSWAIILGYVLLEFRYRIKAVGAFVVGIGFIAMGAASLLPYRYQTAEPLVPALNSYWIYIHVSVTLTSYAAFAMAGGLGLMYLFKERAVNRGSQSRFYAAFPDLETIDELERTAVALAARSMLHVRLAASPDAVLSRLTRRHDDDETALRWHAQRHPELADILDRAGFINDLRIDTTDKPVKNVAREILTAIVE